MSYIKENIITTKLQKLHNPGRNLRMGNKLPTLFLKKPLCMAICCSCAKYSLKGVDNPVKCPIFYSIGLFVAKATYIRI